MVKRLLNILILLGFPTSNSIQYIEEAVPASYKKNISYVGMNKGIEKKKGKKCGDKKPK